MVGQVPGSPGLWVNVGHHGESKRGALLISGHGMGRITFITKALSHTLLTGEWHPMLPTCLKITEERLEKAKTNSTSAFGHDKSL